MAKMMQIWYHMVQPHEPQEACLSQTQDQVRTLPFITFSRSTGLNCFTGLVLGPQYVYTLEL